jgi:tetratricopeptide (TPR) repeat protein
MYKCLELCDQEKYEEANTYINEAITEAPKSYDAWFVKMGVLLFLERYNEGWACGVEAKSINPELFRKNFEDWHYRVHNDYGLRGILENHRKGIPWGRKCLKSQH